MRQPEQIRKDNKELNIWPHWYSACEHGVLSLGSRHPCESWMWLYPFVIALLVWKADRRGALRLLANQNSLEESVAPGLVTDPPSTQKVESKNKDT